MNVDLHHRVAFVTGAAGGIGRSIADQLFRQGARLILNDTRRAELHEATDALRRRGCDAHAVLADIGDEEQVSNAVQEARARVGDVDILVNNAGISPKRQGRKIALADIDRAEWDNVIRVNLTGSFLCAKYFAPAMVGRKWGRIINITSVMAKFGTAGELGTEYGPTSPSGAHYCVSKAGMTCLTFCIARELAGFGITCNAVAPGAVGAGLGEGAAFAATARQIPLGRLATANDVAAAVGFLASDSASYITGEVIDVNGGWLMD